MSVVISAAERAQLQAGLHLWSGRAAGCDGGAEVSDHSTKLQRMIHKWGEEIERLLHEPRERSEILSRAEGLRAAADEIERLRQDRSDALSVTSRDGLLASEWVARTGKAERELAEAREWIAGAHRDGCESFWWDRGPQVTLTRRPCDCGRDKFLAKP